VAPVRHATTAEESDAGTRFLAVYLNDHLAGSTAVLELVRRAAGEYEGSELGTFLSRLAGEFEEDREALRRVMSAAGVREQAAKLALAWLAEKAGRLKLNGSILSRSPLTPLVELEAVELGVHGKVLLWHVLRARLPPGSAAVDLDELIARAERQAAELEEHRVAAGAALAG
jgi:hypothetical protein